MLMGFMPMGGMVGRNRDATVTYAGITNSSDLSEPSLTVPIGTASSDRYVVVIMFHDNGTLGLGTIGSITVGGIACTKVVQTANLNNTAAAIFVTNSPVTTGTTATLVNTGGLAESALGFATYAVYGINPTASASSTVSTDDPSTTIDVPAGGVIIAGSVNDTDSNACTWTGVTEDFDSAFVSGVKASGGYFTTETPVTGRTVTANWSTSSSDKLVAAAWGPA
jgi:hypothetical protein